MATPADQVPTALTSEARKSFEPDTKQAGFVKSSKSSSDSLPDSELELKDIPFLDPNVAQKYRRIYEEAGYECLEAFDPTLQWTQEEEKKVKHKVDFHVISWACIMFFALNVDRGNLKQAIADNLLDDMGLSTNDYNTGKDGSHYNTRHHGDTNINRKHDLLLILPFRRIAVTIDFQEARTGQVDSHAEYV